MLRVIAPLFAPQLIAFTLVFGGVQALEAGVLGEAWSTDVVVEGVEWGDRVHTTPEELSAWLRERGRAYHVWAGRHPQAAVRLERSARAQAESREAQALLPVETSTLVLLALVLASGGLLATMVVGRPPATGRVRFWPSGRLALAIWVAGIGAAVALGVLAARLL